MNMKTLDTSSRKVNWTNIEKHPWQNQTVNDGPYLIGQLDGLWLHAWTSTQHEGVTLIARVQTQHKAVQALTLKQLAQQMTCTVRLLQHHMEYSFPQAADHDNQVREQTSILPLC